MRGTWFLMGHVPFMLRVAWLDRVALFSVLALNDSQFIRLAATHRFAAVFLLVLPADSALAAIGFFRGINSFLLSTMHKNPLVDCLGNVNHSNNHRAGRHAAQRFVTDLRILFRVFR
jgi:hypothetical protein